MRKSYPISVGSYEETENAIDKALKKAAKNSDSELLEDIADEPSKEERQTMEVKCGMVHRIVGEALDEYREGGCTFKEMIGCLVEALEAIK